MNNLQNLLEVYQTESINEKQIKDTMLGALEELKNPFDRDSRHNHFTASCLLLNSDKTKFLILHHKKLEKWIQPGGHCDGEGNLLEVAKNEAREESGISAIEAVDKNIFDLDIHYIPESSKEFAHRHYDVRFLLKTIDNDNFLSNHESHEIKWIDFETFNAKNLTLEPSVKKLAEKYQTLY
jgi:8-oxo-dGTP pyrophosphatase MutT (NUDIX family)